MMVNGRDEVMKSVKAELTFLESMRETATENIAIQTKLIVANEAKLKEANELMARFEQRTEMCWKLQSALEEFGAGIESLKAL